MSNQPTRGHKRRFRHPRKQAGYWKPTTESLESRVLLAADSLPFEPLPAEAGVGSLPESAPFVLAAGFEQELLVSQQANPQLPAQGTSFFNSPVSPSSKFDMLTLNETGEDAGRYLFRSHEVQGACIVEFSFCDGGNAGVSRTDLLTGETVTIAQRADYEQFDGVVWTPWGTVLTNEEIGSFTVPPEQNPFGPFPLTVAPNADPDVPDAKNGLVYEITNPLADPADVNIVARPALGSMAHEGIQIDSAGNVYGIDEFAQGAIYKFVPATPGDLSSGQLFALKVTDPGDLGAAEWVPLSGPNGEVLPGVENPQVDGRQAAVDQGATTYDRPEDLQVGFLDDGTEVLYAALTGTHQVLSIELSGAPYVREFVSRNTIDLATGAAVGADLRNPDNLAMDAAGRLYIVEDNTPSDVWTAVDADGDGVAESMGRWASLSTAGAESTGLYFSPFDPNVAYINVQHPSNAAPEYLGDATFIIRSVPQVELIDGQLLINGTQDDDDLFVKLIGSGQIVVMMNGLELGRFDQDDVQSIELNGRDGDDRLRVSSNLAVDAVIRGGLGDDFLEGGRGNDQLFGGQGSDLLLGRLGDDLLDGEDGLDELIGGPGDNLFFNGNRRSG